MALSGEELKGSELKIEKAASRQRKGAGTPGQKGHGGKPKGELPVTRKY